MKKILVLGAGGFIGSHLVTKLKLLGHYVIGADLKYPEFNDTHADKFHIMDLSCYNNVQEVVTSDIDIVYQLAADMGGAGYIFTGDNDANIMNNSAKINLNTLDAMKNVGIKKILYTSSACIYPKHNQTDPNNPLCTEESAYPAYPDSEYGWEKLFSERLYMSYARNYGFDVRIPRLHNIFGPEGAWNNGREKAPAALCRKVAMAEDHGCIDVWGPGTQTRSFLFIDECLTGLLNLWESSYYKPINLGSEYYLSINNLALLISDVANKEIKINNVDGPIGVNGRTSDNTLMEIVTGWRPKEDLRYGLEKTYAWIKKQIENN
jgi:nucleoside-diphosphate-sugar epimerase